MAVFDKVLIFKTVLTVIEKIVTTLIGVVDYVLNVKENN